jgi:TPR repeat protein
MAPVSVMDDVPSMPDLEEQKALVESGDVEAQYLLGVIYEHVSVTPSNNINAYMWFSIASENESTKAARKMKFLEKKMSFTEIDEAQELAKKCKKRKYKGC